MTSPETLAQARKVIGGLQEFLSEHPTEEAALRPLLDGLETALHEDSSANKKHDERVAELAALLTNQTLDEAHKRFGLYVGARRALMVIFIILVMIAGLAALLGVQARANHETVTWILVADFMAMAVVTTNLMWLADVRQRTKIELEQSMVGTMLDRKQTQRLEKLRRQLGVRTH